MLYTKYIFIFIVFRQFVYISSNTSNRNKTFYHFILQCFTNSKFKKNTQTIAKHQDKEIVGHANNLVSTSLATSTSRNVRAPKERSYSQESIPRTQQHHHNNMPSSSSGSSKNTNHVTSLSNSHNSRLNQSSHQLNHYQSKYQTNTSNTLNNANNINNRNNNKKSSSSTTFSSSSPQLNVANNKTSSHLAVDEQIPPPIPPLPLHYQRSDGLFNLNFVFILSSIFKCLFFCNYCNYFQLDESYATESRDQKKQRAISKAVRQAELKRLRIAQEIQREQEEIEVQLKELEARGVLIEKALRGENQQVEKYCSQFSQLNILSNFIAFIAISAWNPPPTMMNPYLKNSWKYGVK